MEWADFPALVTARLDMSKIQFHFSDKAEIASDSIFRTYLKDEAGQLNPAVITYRRDELSVNVIELPKRVEVHTDEATIQAVDLYIKILRKESTTWSYEQLMEVFAKYIPPEDGDIMPAFNLEDIKFDPSSPPIKARRDDLVAYSDGFTF